MIPALRGAPPVPNALFERLAVAILLCLALVPRVRDLNRPFDRGFEGYQGSFHAIAALNYERLGVQASGGYPVLNIDLPTERASWFVYTNHSPATPLLGWMGLRLLGQEGWAEASEDGTARAGVEAPLRLPFLALHLLGLLALWWVARVAFGTQVALITLALVSSLPVSALYGTLVNVETPCLPFLLLAVGCYGNYVRERRRTSLMGMGAGFLLASSVTYAPVFFLPFLCLRSLWKRERREALLVGFVGGMSCALPILAHGQWAGAVLESLGKSPAPLWARAGELVQPLISGDIPFGDWLLLQLQHAARAQGFLLVCAAAFGFVLCVVRGLSASWDRTLARFEWPTPARSNVDLALPLALGGFAYFLAFYKHTAEEQWSFQLLLVPAATLLAARALHGLSLPLQRLRGGIAPLVLLTASVMLPGLARFESWRSLERAPGPRDDGTLTRGPAAPLPVTVGKQIAAILPAGSVGFHPKVLGLTPASAWYARRSLLAVEGPKDPVITLVLHSLGLEQAPRFMLLPTDPPPAAKEIIDELRRALGPPTTQTEFWGAWQL